MDFVTGYGLIPIAAVIGVAISYMDAKQNNTEKSVADHAKIAILLAFIAGLAVFVNSGEAKEFFTGGAKAVAEGAGSAMSGGASVASAAAQSAPAAAAGVAAGAVAAVPRAASTVRETFATGLANF